MPGFANRYTSSSPTAIGDLPAHTRSGTPQYSACGRAFVATPFREGAQAVAPTSLIHRMLDRVAEPPARHGPPCEAVDRAPSRVETPKAVVATINILIIPFNEVAQGWTANYTNKKPAL